MQRIDALRGGAGTWLVHAFGSGLDGEDRFTVERYRAMVDGDIRPVRPEGSGAKGRRGAKPPVVSRKQVEALRPARAEIIICTGLRTRGGWQIWGSVALGIFHDRRQRG